MKLNDRDVTVHASCRQWCFEGVYDLENIKVLNTFKMQLLCDPADAVVKEGIFDQKNVLWFLKFTEDLCEPCI